MVGRRHPLLLLLLTIDDGVNVVPIYRVAIELSAASHKEDSGIKREPFG